MFFSVYWPAPLPLAIFIVTVSHRYIIHQSSVTMIWIKNCMCVRIQAVSHRYIIHQPAVTMTLGQKLQVHF